MALSCMFAMAHAFFTCANARMQLGRFIDRAPRDLIVLDCSQRVDAPVRVLGYFAGAEQIFFGAGQRCSFRLFAGRVIPAGAPPW